MARPLRTNKGRITRADQAWGPAHAENDIIDREAASCAAKHEEFRKECETAHAVQLYAGAGDTEVVEAEIVEPCTDVAVIATPSHIAPLPPTLAIPLPFIQAALITAASGDIRYYLNAIYIHAIDGEVRICSTDGHRLCLSRFVPVDQPIPEWAEAGILLPRDELVQVMPLLAKNATFGKWDHNAPAVVIEYATGAPAAIVRSANGFASFRLTPVDGKFPDYAKVLAGVGATLANSERDALTATGLNAAYLRGAADIAKLICPKFAAIHSFMGNGENPAVFTFDGAPDTLLIIMPVRTGDAVSDGVVKLLGRDAVSLSITALKAHLTRTTKLLASAKGTREQEQIEAKRTHYEERIAHLSGIVNGKGPKQIAAPVQS